MANKGFTLVELLIVIAISAIVITVAIPSFQETIRKNRITGEINEFLGAINLARSEAQKRGVRVTLCKSTDGRSCASAASGYHQGWIIFSDLDNDAVLDTGGGSSEELIRASGSKTALSITATSGTSPVADFISFTPNGVAKLLNGAFQAGTMRFCVNGSSEGKSIILSSAGRVRVDKATCES